MASKQVLFRLALVLCGSLGACVNATVIESGERVLPSQAQPAVSWQAATPESLPGLWESTAVEGEAAAFVWKIYYHFVEDGSYSGAALVLDQTKAEFQTLSGTWSLREGALTLDALDAVPAWIHEEKLRLEGANGTASFRRVRL